MGGASRRPRSLVCWPIGRSHLIDDRHTSLPASFTNRFAVGAGLPLARLVAAQPSNAAPARLTLSGLRCEHARRGEADREDLTLPELEPLRLLARHLRPDVAAVMQLQLDAHLEAEVHHALHQRLR